MATLLATVQEVCRRLVQPVPNTVFGSADKQVSQMMALLQEGLDNLVSRGAWQQLNKELTWLTVASESQGNILTGLGSPLSQFTGLSYILPETLWDRTNVLPLVGPLDAQDWQAMKAWIINGPRFQFRLRGNEFLVNPAPTAGWTWAMEYQSEYAIVDAGGTVYSNRFAADTDQIMLPSKIVAMDLRWRWKKEKNLPYAQDFDDLEKMLVDALARAKPAKVLDMSNPACYGTPRPVIVVPGGNWNV